MAKTSIYLPDDVAEQARAYGIPISEVAQNAVRQAVKDAQIKENAKTDPQAVAERLRGTQRNAAEWKRTADAQARAQGADWARQEATAAELEYVATHQGTAADYLLPTSLVFSPAGAPTSPASARWEHFQAGAREVWEEVKPMLAGTGDGGSPGTDAEAGQ